MAVRRKEDSSSEVEEEEGGSEEEGVVEVGLVGWLSEAYSTRLTAQPALAVRERPYSVMTRREGLDHSSGAACRGSIV